MAQTVLLGWEVRRSTASGASRSLPAPALGLEGEMLVDAEMNVPNSPSRLGELKLLSSVLLLVDTKSQVT